MLMMQKTMTGACPACTYNALRKKGAPSAPQWEL
jgi:hypothetical protein